MLAYQDNENKRRWKSGIIDFPIECPAEVSGLSKYDRWGNEWKDVEVRIVGPAKTLYDRE